MRALSLPFRLAAVIAAAALLAACGDQSGPQAGFAPPPPTAASGDTLAAVKAKGSLVVGVKYDTRPFGFVPEGQAEPVGFDIDLATEFAHRLGVEPQFVQVTTENRMLNLETGKIDMIMASMIRTPEREKAIGFSIDYFSDQQLLLVPTGSRIRGVGDLDATTTVALAQGGAEEANLRKAAPDAHVISYQSWPDALQAMLRGEADAVTSTLGLLYGLSESAKSAGAAVQIVGDGFADGPLGAGFRLGDDGLRTAFNDTLVDMSKDGTYDTIFNKWWGEVMDKPYVIDPSHSGT